MNNQNEDSPKIPPARAEITAEIVALDCLLADLILKCQGNARELDNLVGVLDDHLAACEMGRDDLLGIESERPLTMTDLPIVEQKMIFGAGLFSAYLLETVAQITQTNPELLGEKISENVNKVIAELPEDEITETLNTYLVKHAEALQENRKKFLVRMERNNNWSQKDKQYRTQAIPHNGFPHPNQYQTWAE